MATLRGQDGLIALGGYVIGTVLVDGAVAASGTTVNFKSSGTLIGVSAPGDTFVVGANTYTVTSSFIVAATNQLTGVTFTPGAIGGFSDNAAVTYNLASLGQVRQWSMDVSLQTLETTVMRDTFHGYRTGLVGWKGQGEALFDRDDPQQGALLALITGATPVGTVASLLFGLQAGAARDFYGGAILTNMRVRSQIGALVSVTFDWESNDVARLTYV